MHCWYLQNKLKTSRAYNIVKKNLLETQTGQSLPPLSLRKNFSWTFIANVIYGICQWGTIIVLAKISTPEIVGRFTLGVAVATPVILLANLHLRAVQVTDSKQQYQFCDYLELRLMTTIAAILVIAGISFSHLYTGVTGLIIFLVGLGKAVEAISDIFQGQLQYHERMDGVARSIILRSLASMAVTIAILGLTQSLAWALLGVVVSNIVLLFNYDIPTATWISRGSQSKMNWRNSYASLASLIQRLPNLSQLALYALPVGLLMMMLSLTLNIPRYFIEQHLGQRELGIFAAIAYIPVAGITFITALGQSALPRLSRYYAERNSKAFQSLLLKMMNIGLGIGIIGLIIAVGLGKPLLTIAYRSEYAEQSTVLVWLMVWGGFLYLATFLGYGVAAARYFKTSLGCSCLLVAITFASCIWLIPAYGLNGAAIALAIGGLAQLIGNLTIVGYAIYKIR
jgi:O-antigen/teichoic acid export membrane protein